MGRRCVAFLLRGGVLAVAIVVCQGRLTLGQGKDNPADRPPDAKSESPRTRPLGARDILSEGSVAAALSWLGRHQSRDGSWGLQEYRKRCKDPSCTGPGTFSSDAAGTALGLLPLLAAGQTHKTKGPYRKIMYDALYRLIRNQKQTGNLSGGASSPMYAHGMCTIALCEAYGATRDNALGKSAQQAIEFIEAAQNPKTGGWRYVPGQDGDTSVLGWQLTALKSGELAGLKVKPETFAGARRWLESVAKGEKGGQFAYMPHVAASPSMTAVGTLCSLFLGSKPESPAVIEGVTLLTGNRPGNSPRNAYYFYYATQVMHRMDDAARFQWRRDLCKALEDSQVREGCATGSWDPDKPSKDAWGEPGGRLYTTSLSALALESHYRYLLIYKRDRTKPREANGLQ